MAIYFILLFQSLIASGTHIVAKVVVRDVDPVTLTMLRSSMAAIALFGFSLISKTSFFFPKKDRRSIIVLSILAIPVNQFLFLTAMKYTSPANAALFYATTPALVLTLSWILGKELMNWKKAIGVFIAFCGVVVILFERGLDIHSENTFGNILLMIAVIAWALYTVLGRSLIMEYGAFRTSAATMVWGTLFYLPVGLIPTSQFDYSSLSFMDWSGIMYLSLGTSIFAYYLWYYALSKIEASKVAIFSNLQPVLTVLLAAMFLGQATTSVFVVGGFITLSGVIITQTA